MFGGYKHLVISYLAIIFIFDGFRANRQRLTGKCTPTGMPERPACLAPYLIYDVLSQSHKHMGKTDNKIILLGGGRDYPESLLTKNDEGNVVLWVIFRAGRLVLLLLLLLLLLLTAKWIEA